jgi:hypothetical protein
VERFARRNQVLFMGGTFALGMLAARFLKSSKPEQSQQYGGYRSYSDRGGYSEYGGYTTYGVAGTMNSGYGSGAYGTDTFGAGHGNGAGTGYTGTDTGFAGTDTGYTDTTGYSTAGTDLGTGTKDTGFGAEEIDIIVDDTSAGMGVNRGSERESY